jgi:hypothetical protein
VTYRSCMHHMGTICAIWKHMGAMCFRWEADGARWELHVLYGSRMNCMGPAYPLGERWHHLGAAWDGGHMRVHTIWEPCAPVGWLPYGAICLLYSVIWLPSGAQGSQGSNMVHTAPYGPHMAHASPIWHHSQMLASGSHTALKNAHSPHVVHMAPIRCTWHPNGACGSLCIIW